MEIYTLEGNISNTQRLEFSIDQDEICLISLTFESPERYWLNANLYDPLGRLRGQIVYPKEKESYYLSKHFESSSDSFIAGELPKGVWYIEYALAPKENVNLNLSIEWSQNPISPVDNLRISVSDLGDEEVSFTSYLNQLNSTIKKNKQWYRGDFHTHTIESDGQMTIEDNQKQALKMNLDFYIATDHNVIPTKWHDPMPIVYPGIELTSHLGHCNLLFINHMIFERYPLKDISSEKDFLLMMTKKNSDDFLLSINHPFLTIWKWLVNDLLLTDIDTIEIINDPTYEDNIQANLASLAFWDLLLQDGYQITVIGGSDSHLRPEDSYPNSLLPSLIGDPATLVYAESLAPKDMMDSIRLGHVMVSRLGNFVFKVGDAIAGSKLGWQAEQDYPVTYSYESFGDIETVDLHAEIVQDGQIIHSSKELTGSLTIKLRSVSTGYSWIRAQVIHQSLGLVAVSNPVYFGEKETTYLTWGDVLKDFNVQVK